MTFMREELDWISFSWVFLINWALSVCDMEKSSGYLVYLMIGTMLGDEGDEGDEERPPLPLIRQAARVRTRRQTNLCVKS